MCGCGGVNFTPFLWAQPRPPYHPPFLWGQPRPPYHPLLNHPRFPTPPLHPHTPALCAKFYPTPRTLCHVLPPPPLPLPLPVAPSYANLVVEAARLQAVQPCLTHGVIHTVHDLLPTVLHDAEQGGEVHALGRTGNLRGGAVDEVVMRVGGVAPGCEESQKLKELVVAVMKVRS